MSSEISPKSTLNLPDSASSSSGHLVNTAVDYTDNHVNGELHRAFQSPQSGYDDKRGTFIARKYAPLDENALFDSQQAFANALEQYEKDADPKYKTGLDVKTTHTWEEVMKQVETTCNEYKGVGKEGTMMSIRCGLRNYLTAAPAIEAWLKLLPSTSIYGSVLCGGLTIILEAAIRIGKIREDTYLAIDQIPLRIERAEVFMRTYRDGKIKKQAADLYRAIIDALQHILAWYKRKATTRYFSSFMRGPEYAATLRQKMKDVEKAAQAMDDQAGLDQHMRLEDIRQVTWQSKGQLSNIERTAEELKILALEARNHIYAVFKDTEAWQEIVQFWAATRQASEQSSAALVSKPNESNSDARNRLLQSLDYHKVHLLRDVEDALRQIFLFSLADQDRAIAIIQDSVVEEWLLKPDFRAILIQANSRRHEIISPASVACAMIIHIFSNTITRNRMPVITTYWFCGSHTNSPGDSALSLMRSLICQLLVTGPFELGFRQTRNFDSQNLNHLLDMFAKLLRQLWEGTAVVCIIDGISYYEDSHLRNDTCKVIKRLVRLSRAEAPIFKVLITSPTRTTQVHKEPRIEKHIVAVEIPQHVNGAKQGFNHRAMVVSTEQKVRRLSRSLGARETSD